MTNKSLHIDNNIGGSPSQVFWMRSKDGKSHWCRTQLSFFGSELFEFNDEIKSPFDPRFNGSYAEGKGSTKEEAYENMQKDIKETTDALWAI